MPDQSNRDLRISITVMLEQPGPNDRWDYEIDIPVPPQHLDEEHEYALIRHELDRAMTDFQRENFEYSRAERIIHQYDLRVRVIENLIKHAPKALSRKALAAAILAVIHEDAAALIAQYGTRELED